LGPVRASIFRNPIQQNGRNILLPKVVIEVRYKDKSGQWKGTNSLSLNDLPKAVLALQMAYSYLLENRESPSEPDPDLDEESEYRVAPQQIPPGSYGQRNVYAPAS
ncbi:MAG: hypothetical protein KC944_23640, partial [Candidatus Omnitrophica bacterium]|nr:hypothetical protein [Candidatus Omnitrophota bacterium]